MDIIKKIQSITLSPFGILSGVVLGAAAGHFFPQYASEFGGIGHVFSSLVQLCIMPILLTSVSLSLLQFITSNALIKFHHAAFVFVIFMVGVALLGTSVAFIMNPGSKIDISSSETLHDTALGTAQISRSIDEPLEPRISAGVIKFLSKSVPENILHSVSGDQYFPVLIFSIMVGIALAFILPRPRENMTEILRSIRATFENIFKVIASVLPFALFFIMAKDVSQVGTETIFGMSSYILNIYLAFFIMFFINSLVIAFATKTNYLKSVEYLKEPLIISMVANSGIAAIPSLVNTLIHNFKLDHNKVNLLVSIGVIIGQFGVVLYFAFSVIFVVQFYGVSLDLTAYIYVILMSALASLSAIGDYDSPILPLMAVILEPLGVPLAAFIVLFSAVDPIISPLRSLLLVQTNCSIISVVVKKEKAHHRQTSS